MKTSTKYLISFILNLILVFAWPVGAFFHTSHVWLFLCGAMWWSDVADIVPTWVKYINAKEEENA